MIIAICRDAFSGGEALAERVAQRLDGVAVSREEILTAAAQQYRIPVEELTAAMERRPSFWDKALGGAHVGYLPAFRACLCQRAERGNIVYAGHLGHLLFPGVSHVLSVRVVADRETRLHTLMQQEALAHPQALAALEREDRTLREWTRFLFGVEWGDPALYDVTVNLSRLRLETAAESVAQLADTPQFQTTPASLQALRDLTLHSRVSATLAMDFRTRDARLKVTAADGIVTISGTTRWVEVAEAIPTVVRRIAGVKGVRSEITGGTPPPGLTWY